MERRRLKKRNVILTVLIAAGVIAALGLALHFFEVRSLVDEQFGDTGDWGEGSSETHYLTIGDTDYKFSDNTRAYLIIGTDERNGSTKKKDLERGELSDFLVLALIDITKEKYAFLQIDRDTITDVPVLDKNDKEDGTYPEQICTAHWYGSTDELRCRNTVKAVSTLLGGFPIDGYYTIKMGDVGAINHAIGGVVVDVNYDMTHLDPDLKKGSSVLLSDKQAEIFVRARMDVGKGTNVERMSRQREYMQKVYNLTLSQIRENPAYIDDLYEELNGKIFSELPDNEVSKIANQVARYESEGILTFTGKSEEADTLLNGEEHAEFYVDQGSIVQNLSKVIDLEEDTGE